MLAQIWRHCSNSLEKKAFAESFRKIGRKLKNRWQTCFRACLPVSPLKFGYEINRNTPSKMILPHFVVSSVAQSRFCYYVGGCLMRMWRLRWSQKTLQSWCIFTGFFLFLNQLCSFQQKSEERGHKYMFAARNNKKLPDQLLVCQIGDFRRTWMIPNWL